MPFMPETSQVASKTKRNEETNATRVQLVSRGCGRCERHIGRNECSIVRIRKEHTSDMHCEIGNGNDEHQRLRRLQLAMIASAFDTRDSFECMAKLDIAPTSLTL
jgi:hypothetical protein